MRRVPLPIAAAVSITVAIAAALTTALPAQAAVTPPAPGDCFARSAIARDEVTLESKVDCRRPHRVQLLAVGPLPASVVSLGYTALRDPKNAKARAALERAATGICNGRRVVQSIWPGTGAAIARSLPKDTAGLWGSVYPVVLSQPGNPDVAFRTGWALPDKASFDAGVRKLLCTYAVASNGPDLPFTGDVRAMESARGPLQFRVCATSTAASACSAPHRAEDVFAFQTTEFPTVATANDATEAMYAPYDATCKSIGNALVGAARTDLAFLASLTTAPVKRGERAVIVCSAYAAARDASGERVVLPAGTVVGLGTARLG